jgi:N-acetylglucosaminyldiphosphoundecaprenol N-acetyl-beta-D-mannosaminyltransferase
MDLDSIDMEGLVRQLIDASLAGSGQWVVTANLDHLRRCRDGSEYADLVRQADVVVADGRPLLWAARLSGASLPGLVAGSDLVPALALEAAERGARVLLIGGAPGAADGAARALAELAPGLDLADAHVPPMGFENDPQELQVLESAVRDSRADLVFVALGSPLQERCILRLREHLPGASWVGVGITLSFLSGDVSRAPMWMRRAGLEWSWRLLCEPRRLFRRYILQGLPFALRLFVESICSRWMTKQPGELTS